MTKEIDLGIIKQGMKENPKFVEYIKLLSKRSRTRDCEFSRVLRVLKDEGCEDWTKEQLDKFFSIFQEAGACTVLRAKNKEPRVRWAGNIQSIACAALGIPEPRKATKNKIARTIEAGDRTIRDRTPPRRELPRIGGTYTPPVDTSGESSLPAIRAVAPAGMHIGDVIVFERGGAEFVIDRSMIPAEAIDISKVPPEAISFRRFING